MAFDQPYTEYPEEDALQCTFTATLQEPFQQPDFDFLLSVEADGAADRTANNNQQVRHTPSESQSYQHRDSAMPAFSFEEVPRKNLSYYVQNLTEEDKQALACGEKNHNHKDWSARDLVAHHEARKDLVPCVMPRMEKINALLGIEHDRQHSQRALIQVKDKVGEIPSRSRSKELTDKVKDKYATYNEATQASRSSCDLPSSPWRPSLSPCPSISNLVIDAAPRERGQLHARATSNGDYFSQRRGRRSAAYRASRISPLASVSDTTSDSSTRVRSPLAQEVQYRHNPEVTFDSFLAPHKSGKGEAFRDAENAEEVMTPKVSVEASPHAKGKDETVERDALHVAVEVTR